MSLSPGHRLGRYEILKPLGAGGMGEVYRARDMLTPDGAMVYNYGPSRSSLYVISGLK